MAWWGIDYAEKQATLWHNRLAHIILYGIDARGRENLAEADGQLAALLEQKVPGNQKHKTARWWESKKRSLARMWSEAVEVAQGTRAPKLRGARDPGKSGPSKVVAKKTFYSGDLSLTVHLLEGHHEDPSKRRKQVHGCEHNVVYRVAIKPVRGGHEAGIQWVCPPAYLEHGVDSLHEMRSAAHAALSFADDEGWPVEQYAAFSESGWHVGATKLHAWPREPKTRSSR